MSCLFKNHQFSHKHRQFYVWRRLLFILLPRRDRLCHPLLRFHVRGGEETKSCLKKYRQTAFACYVCQGVILRACKHVRVENRDLEVPVDSCYRLLVHPRFTEPHRSLRDRRENRCPRCVENMRAQRFPVVSLESRALSGAKLPIPRVRFVARSRAEPRRVDFDSISRANRITLEITFSRGQILNKAEARGWIL